jgi:hypothetical protein
MPTTWLSFGVLQDGVEYKDGIDAYKIRPTTDGVLDALQRLDEIWLSQPVSGCLHILVNMSSGE